MSKNKSHTKDLAAELTRLGNRGVRKENRKMGLPNVYSKNVEITTKKPSFLS